MNHNYYYILLGKKAGGPGTQPTSNCSDSLQFRYYSINTPAGQSGEWYYGISDPDPALAWSGLVFGGIVEVWASTQVLGPGTKLYIDQAQTQEVKAVDDGAQFRIEANLFTYRVGTGITAITQMAEPPDRQIRMSGPEPGSCALSGPYTQTVWVARDQWQQVDRVWLDSTLTQPYVGGGNWYYADDTTIPAAGTTLQINNCGWVIGFYAC